MLIGELAAAAGVTARALRFYEEQGLLAPDRTPGGYRQYGPHAVTRVRNIRALHAVGFTLADIRLFLPLLDKELPARIGPEAGCERAFAVARRRLAELDALLVTLVTIRGGLAALVGGGPAETGHEAGQVPPEVTR
ncbi:MAG: MerR family transcriptional regulator [Mycobacteriales bacterium]